MGKKKANVALANLMLRICYHMLKNRRKYEEVGDLYFKKRENSRELKMIKELTDKGFIIQKVG